MTARGAVRRGGGALPASDPSHVSAPWIARALAIAPEEALFDRRGFPDGSARPRLETAGAAFIEGHNLAVAAPSVERVSAGVAAQPPALRGFFAEGAAMGAALRSLLRPWRNDFPALIAALTPRYVHLAHVGVGWAAARFPCAQRWFMRALDPMLAPLVLDGRGFHDGYFRSRAVGRGWRALSGLNDGAAVYDQGIGRSLWFSGGADPSRIAAAVAALEEARHADLWAGVGLAAVYAGGADEGALATLVETSGSHRRVVAQGAAFAVAVHHRAGAVPGNAAIAAKAITGLEADELTAIVDAAFDAARRPPGSALSRYAEWRRTVARRIEQRWAR